MICTERRERGSVKKVGPFCLPEFSNKSRQLKGGCELWDPFYCFPPTQKTLLFSLFLFLLKILTNLVTLALHVLISLSSAYSAKHGPNADVFCCCNFISSHHEIPLLYIKNLHTPHQHKQTRLPFLFPRFLLNGSTSLVIPNHQAGTFPY